MVDNLAPVNNKVKGLLKGLRYISQIFDGEKEQEMVIGNPTDVKHVAHIGYEGPSASMNEFNTSTFGQDGKEFGSTDVEEIPHGVAFSPSREKDGSPRPRRTRHHSISTETATTDADTQESHGSHRSRKSRPSDSQSQEGHRSRHHKHHSKHQSSASASANASGSESTSQEVPKKSRKKERRRKGSDGVDDKVIEEAL